MKLSLKVKALNIVRNIFRIPGVESFLASQTRGKSPNQLVSKLVPNPYQYPIPSFRELKRDGLTLRVDISDYIGHYLYFGFTDEGMTALFALCRERFTVLDIGANIGWTVLNLARLAGHGKVIGFEPDLYNFERCSENLRLNNFKNAEVFNVGLGAHAGRVNMQVRTPSNRGGNRIAPQGSGASHLVDIVRLDDFPPARDLTRIDLVKLDVEGYELHVMKGAEALLRKHRPMLFIELDDNNLRDQGDSAEDLIHFLLDIGYRRIAHAEKKSPVMASDDFRGCHFDLIAT
jgi:FkbM family methyltransferase